VNRRVLLLGVLAFIAAMLAMWPARWIAGFLPSVVQCRDWRGTVWHGQCRQLLLAAPGKPAATIESATWTLHFAPLLHLRLSAEVALTDARGDASGHVEFTHDGLLVLRDVSARALLDPQTPDALPRGWRGRADIEQFELDWQANQLRHLQGRIQLSDLRDQQGQELGSYRLDFPPAAGPPFRGSVDDTGGPLRLHATLELTDDRRWSLTGTVAARAGSDAQITHDLDALGAPDAAGNYPLSAAGSFR